MPDGYSIQTTAFLKPGKGIMMNSWGRQVLFMHPLDFIALENPDALSRIEPAICWILGQAHGRLDAVLHDISEHEEPAGRVPERPSL